MNTIQYSPRIGPLYAIGVSLGLTQVLNANGISIASEFLQGSLGDRPTYRPTDNAALSFTIVGIYLLIKGKKKKGRVFI